MATVKEKELPIMKGFDGHTRIRTSFSLRTDLRDRIESLCRFQNRSISNLLEIMLLNQIDAQEQKAAENDGYKIPKTKK